MSYVCQTLGKRFTFSDYKYCPVSGAIKGYTSLFEAQNECWEDRNCNVITDYSCDGDPWKTCTGILKPSPSGSCAWKKNTGIPYINTFIFQLIHNVAIIFKNMKFGNFLCL